MRIRVCPFSVAVFLGSAAGYVVLARGRQQGRKKSKEEQGQEGAAAKKNKKVVFVLGGPGSGKGTQCALLEQRMGWKHLSAGDLLRAERGKGGESGDLIDARIAAGALVPSEVTCRLLVNAVTSDPNRAKFLIDGFPRSRGNLDAWDAVVAATTAAVATAITVEFVLCLECPEEVMIGRLLERGKESGRADDADLEVIRKRFATHEKETQPIVEYYQRKGQLKTVPSDRPVEQVYQQVSALLRNL